MAFLPWSVFKDKSGLWEVTHTPVFSIKNMNDHELRQSILQDLLILHEYYLAEGATLKWWELFRFLPASWESQRYWILDQLVHPDIYCFIELLSDDTIRIRQDRVLMQAAMDYANFWLQGFDMPPDAIVVGQAGLDMIEELGPENAAISAAMDCLSSTRTVGHA